MFLVYNYLLKGTLNILLTFDVDCLLAQEFWFLINAVSLSHFKYNNSGQITGLPTAKELFSEEKNIEK